MNKTDADAADLMTALERRGCRATAPRRRIAESVARTDGCFTAESISRGLPTIGRATVYRTIKLLVEADAVCKLSMPDGAPAYNLASVRHHHHHAVCVKCGAVEVFEDQAIEHLLRSAGETINGQVLGHRMEFYINCRACVDEVAAG